MVDMSMGLHSEELGLELRQHILLNFVEPWLRHASSFEEAAKRLSELERRTHLGAISQSFGKWIDPGSEDCCHSLLNVGYFVYF